MKKTLFTLIFILAPIVAFAQEKQYNQTIRDLWRTIQQTEKIETDESLSPMILVNSRFVTLNDSINSDHIKEITILKKESAMPLYGAAGKNGAVIITTETPKSQKELIIVDGIEVDNIDGIEASNVESISVLKDKSATELYGEKGKNGVIIITMKKK